VIDQRSDIYSAAALLYELVTGEKAFPDGPLRPRPRPASAVEPSLPVALDPVLSRALSFEAADRYETAAGFAKALRLTIHPREVAASETIATWLQQTPWETDAATASSVSVSATEAPRSASGSSEIATVIEDRNQQTAATVLVGRRTRDDDSRS
jgi:serine/threonine-protein kinase